ncbi:MAG: T9SS type A sorting domain-containing protein [Paludibacter sp.]|nr:T9SS type A sorting domain-containing protein [Paludibacter sp.]
MLQQRLKKITLALGTFALSVTVAQASEALFIHSVADRSFKLETIRRITFNDGNLLLKTTGAETEIALSFIKKISFGNDDPSGILQPGVADPDIVVYVNSGNEVMVKTPLNVLSLTVYDLSGRSLLRTVETNMNIGTLPHGIYLLKIGTTEGSITRKMIKN